MATIRTRKGKDGKPAYQVQIRIRGRATSRTFSRLTDAREWAAEHEAGIRSGRSVVSSKNRSVQDLVSEYLKHELADLSPREQIQRRRQLGWWAREYGSVLLRDLTPATISGGKRRLLAGEGVSGRKLSPATANRYLAALASALSRACSEWQWISENPARRVRRSKEPRGRDRFLSEAELQRLREALEASENSRLRMLVELALSTGGRQGELLGLRWPNIELTNGFATFSATKNGETRRVPVRGPALELLRAASRVRRIDTDLVFVGKGGRASFPRSGWEGALEQARIEKFRFHDLRHTAASYLAMAGASLVELGVYLGHRSPSMTARYAHLTSHHQAALAERMAARFLDS